ncbi:type II toxin-antitoxin system YafQ family toxin [uncultured Selenomonas sp.]|uniref:type II toxin-antitoxin system YafQ family toxin n=1 Tax=uncultured Selenomonas sp. TaxID=159275 RepID=UPI0025DCAA34|nr:type II toxin-antitoxin system YafQ family toxin [uncultured Selenomonas sp.]
MREPKYGVRMTAQFKREYKLAKKRGFDMQLMKDIIEKLSMGEPLPEKNRDHALSRKFATYRECHILPDWLLIYQIRENVLTLTLSRTGSHSDLF